MYGDIYPTKYIGKTTDKFGRLKFQLPQTHHFNPKLVLQVEQTINIELLMLVLDFIMNSRLKKWHFYGIHGLS